MSKALLSEEEEARKGGTEIVNILLQEGAGENLADTKGDTALIVAASHGRTETVKMLIDAGADVNAVNKNGETALMSNVQLPFVASGSNTETIEILIKAGADVNVADKDGDTPLNIAAWHGNGKIVKMLLREGAGVNLPDTSGNTPLITAVMGSGMYELDGHIEVVRMLLQEGAHVNKTNKFGQNALTTHVADCLGDDNLTFSEELALMLINAGEVLYVTDPPVEFGNGEHENALYVVSYTEYIEKGKEFEVSYVRVPA